MTMSSRLPATDPLMPRLTSKLAASYVEAGDCRLSVQVPAKAGKGPLQSALKADRTLRLPWTR